MNLNYLTEKPLFFDNDTNDFEILSVLSISITKEKHKIKLFEDNRTIIIDGKLINYFLCNSRSIEFISEMLYEYLFKEVVYIFNKAFNSYCKYSGKNENYIINNEEKIRSSLVVKYKDSNRLYFFDHLLVYLQNEALKRFSLEMKFKFIRDILYKSDSYNKFIYFLNIDLNKLTIDDIKRSDTFSLTVKFNFNPFLESKQDVIKKIDNIYYIMTNKGTKINKTKLNSQVDRLKRIFDVYYIYYFLNEKSLTNIYKLLRKEFGHIFNEYTLINDFTNLNNEAQQNKSHIKKDLEFIKNVRNFYVPLET